MTDASTLTPAAYLHWDTLRRRTPPKNYSAEEWWCAIKLQRAATRRPLPIDSSAEVIFHLTLPDALLELAEDLERRAAGSVPLSASIKDPTNPRRYVVASLVEEAITSSQLEGAATTRREAADMLRSGRKPQDISERMIANNFAAMRLIADHRDRALTPEFIHQLHSVITDGTLDDRAVGRVRTTNDVFVRSPERDILHRPPPAAELHERLEQLCVFANTSSATRSANSFVPRSIPAIVLHYWLAWLHPYEDGNGRTARALFYWSMLNRGYWIFEFVSISRLLRLAPAQYARTFLHVASDEHDITYFVLHQLQIMQRAIGDLEEYLERKAIERRRASQLLRETDGFNHRQIALLEHALRNEVAAYTIKSHRDRHQVVYQTARTDLLDLHQKGLLQRTTRGRELTFFPADDLESRIRDM